MTSEIVALSEPKTEITSLLSKNPKENIDSDKQTDQEKQISIKT